ncbi:hypothetical protein GEMRC1_008621 [Eukaryota sp. GEM-RC1]
MYKVNGTSLDDNQSSFLHYKAFLTSMHLLPELGDRILKDIGQPTIVTRVSFTEKSRTFAMKFPDMQCYSTFRGIHLLSPERQSAIESVIDSFNWNTTMFYSSAFLNFCDLLFEMDDDKLSILKYALYLQLLTDQLKGRPTSPSLANILYYLVISSKTSPPSGWNPSQNHSLPYIPDGILSDRFEYLYGRNSYSYSCDVPYNHRYRSTEDHIMEIYQTVKRSLNQIKSTLGRPSFSVNFTHLTSSSSSSPSVFPSTTIRTRHPWNLLVLHTWSLLKLKPSSCYDQLATSLARILGFTIRTQQFKIANHLLHSKTSIQTQLFMGEGKTSVIIPLICLGTLSDSSGVVPRINILKPLYKTCLNKYQTLFSCLGLRLGRFVCKRSIYDDADHYQSIIFNSDLLITTAEYRQSFTLKTKNSDDLASVSLENVNDILDESDEILDPRSQLIYPYGQPKVLDGGRLRWVIGEAILQSMKHFFEFPFEHELDFSQRKRHILTYILDGSTSLEDQDSLDLKPSLKSLIIDYALGITHDNSLFNNRVCSVALILRGYFYYSVLERALKLRYRVNYGRDVKRKSLLAVPFRAKDVPALASEFSDVDLAIF